jgi:hypothetical protein
MLCACVCKWKKWYLLKLFQEWGERRIKRNEGGDELKYDMFDIL